MNRTIPPTETQGGPRVGVSSSVQHRFTLVVRTAILIWLVIITWRYVQEATKIWSERVDPQFRDADVFHILLVAWLAVILAAFLVGLSSNPLARRLCVQTVFALALAAFLLISILSGAVLQVLTFLWLLLLAYGMGSRLLAIIFGYQLRDGVEKMVFSLGLGFGIYYLFTFALGLSGLLYSWIVIITLLGVSVWLRRELLKAIEDVFRGLRSLPHQVATRRHDFLSTSLLSIVAFLAVLNFVGAIGPEIRYDSVAYHLPVPKIYIQNHRVVEIPYMFRSYWPKGTEMVFCLGLLLGGQVTAKLFSFGFGLVTAAAIFAFGQHVVSPKASLLAATLFYTAPVVGFLATTAYVDLGWTLFTFLGVYAVSRWLVTQDRRWITVAGLMCAFALSSKTAAIFVVVPLGLAILLAGLGVQKRGLKKTVALAIKFALLIGSVGGLWYVLTYLWTGNPVFPFLNAIFKSPHWAPVNETMNLSSFGTGRDVVSLARLPWDMSFQTSAFDEAAVGGIGVSLLIALCLPLAVTRAVRKEVLFVALVALFCSGEWLLSFEYMRYYVPYLPLVCVLAAYVVDRVYDSRLLPPEAKGRSVTGLVVDGVLLAGFAATLPSFLAGFWFHEVLPYKVALGLESRGEYLSRELRSYDSYQFLNRTYDARDIKVLEVGGYEPLYADGEVHPGVQPCCLPVFELTSDDEVLEWLRQGGFSHLVVNYQYVHGDWAEITYFMSRSFLERHAQVEYAAHNVSIYRLLSDTEIERRALYLSVVDELLQNPSFEDGQGDFPSFWSGHGSPEFDQSGVYSHSGQGAVQVSEQGHLTQAVPVRENEVYVLSEYVKAGSGGQAARLQVNWLDADGSFLATDIGVVPATSEWREHYMPVMAPPGAEVALIHVTSHDQGEGWFDDLSFKSEPGAFSTPESFTSCIQLNTEEADGQLGPGWYEVEEDGMNHWRWMSKEGLLLLGAEDRKDTLEIRGHAVTEHFQAGMALLQVFANDQPIGEEWLADGDFFLAFDLPQGLLERDEFARIKFSLSDAFVPDGQLRELAVIVNSVCLR
jgi:hypothetical protein